MFGSLIFHGFAPSPPANHGGKAGLSVPIVSRPSETRLRLALAQPGKAVVDASLRPPVAAATTAVASTASGIRILRILVCLLCRPVRKEVSTLPRGSVCRNGVAVRRARGGGAGRQGDEPGQGALSGPRRDEARSRPLLPLGRRGDRAGAARAADAAPPLSGRGRGRDDLPEAGAREAAGLDRGRARHVPLAGGTPTSSA